MSRIEIVISPTQNSVWLGTTPGPSHDATSALLHILTKLMMMDAERLSEFAWWSVYPFISLEILYWVLCLIYYIADFMLFPVDMVAKHKLQSSRWIQNFNGLPMKVSNAIRSSLFNHAFGSLPTMMLFAPLYMHYCPPSTSKFNFSVLELTIQVIVILICEEMGFYYTHRYIWHSNVGWKFHLQHHAWFSPVAVAATDAHILEHIITNITPALLGPLVARCHWYVWYTWLAITIVNTTASHSGYNFVLLKASKHDLHHRNINCEFGAVGILDILHKTRYNDLHKQVIMHANPADC